MAGFLLSHGGVTTLLAQETLESQYWRTFPHNHHRFLTDRGQTRGEFVVLLHEPLRIGLGSLKPR